MTGRYNSNNNKGRTQRQIKKPQYDANGKRINEHIPKFISDKPWYYESDSFSVDSNSRKRKTEEEIAEENARTKDMLKHQRLKPDEKIIPNNEPRKGQGINDQFDTIVDLKDTSKDIIVHGLRKHHSRLKTKRKLCENCGSTSHEKRDCLERPKKVGYRFRDHGNTSHTKRDTSLKHDNILAKRDTEDWDTKRDRWHGYDVVNDYDKHIEESKQAKKEEESQSNQLSGLNPEEIEEMRELGLIDDIEKSKTIQTVKSDGSLPSDETSKISVRSLDEKARYLEAIKTGEEVRFNPKSRVFKDLKEGYLNERGQFIPYLKGEAEEFEKLKRFTNNIQNENKEKWELEADPDKPLTDLSFTTEVSPTALMLSIEKKKKDEELLRQAKRKELLSKYGAFEGNEN